MFDVLKFLKEEYQKNYINNPIIYKAVVDFLNNPSNKELYDIAIDKLFEMKSIIDIDVHLILRTSCRILCTLPDGQVWFDSGKGTKNTYENFESKSINENHNTRIAILEALRNNEGQEVKFSTSSGFLEEYYARSTLKLPYVPLGVLRLSVR